MTPTTRMIFRAGALEGYMQARAQTVLPRFIAPPVPLCLWLLLGCLLSATILAWLARVPVYRNGIATVRNEELIAFFPPESKAEMMPGQQLSFKLEPHGPPVVRAITIIEPEILSPATARKKFDSAPYQGPAAVAVAHLGRPNENLPANAYEGTVVEARIETGSKRLITLLPVVGSFFR